MVKNVMLLTLLLFISLGIIYWMCVRRMPHRVFRIVFLVIILVDIALFSYPFNVTRPLKMADLKTRDITFLQEDRSLFRIARFAAPGEYIFPPNIPSIYGIQDIQISTPMNIDYYGKLMQAISPDLYDPHHPKRVEEIRHERALDSPLLDLMNVKYLLSSFPIKHSKFAPIQNGVMRIYENRLCLPRAFIVFEARTAGSRDEARQLISRGDFDPSATVVLEERVGGLQPGDGRVEITAYKPTKVRMTASLEGKGVLVFTDLYFPGWKASVDGSEAPVLRANYAFRALVLKPGEHEIIFSYQGTYIRAGGAVSIASALLFACLFALSWRRRASR
jgi:hypothetical protein